MRISEMKRFVLKLLLFAVFMVLVDCFCSVMFPLLQSHAKGGNTRTNYYLSNKCDADILVLGSSRATHHYLPKILDSLGGVAYNAGNDGMGVLLGYGRYLMCAEKHVPKIVIHDIASFDYEKDDNSKYLKYLRPYGDRPEIRNIISQIGEPFINLKMLSNMYRSSSRIIPNIKDLFADENTDNRGYLPLYKKCKNCDFIPSKKDTSMLKLDSIKLKIFDSFVKETSRQGTTLYFAISPKFSTEKTEQSPRSAYGEKLAKKYNVPLLNHLFTPGISDNPAFFADRTHLNDSGAAAYSKLIVDEIREIENFRNHH